MATRNRNEETCALCNENPSTPEGEHVIPKRLLRAFFPATSGPFEIQGGRTYPEFQAIKLACCLRCNGILNQRFENPGGDPAIRLLEHGDITELGQNRSYSTRLWILKTWLLLAHPRTEYKVLDPRPPAWTHVPEEVFNWTVTDAGPPTGLSAWAFKHTPNVRTDSEDLPRIVLPEVATESSHHTFQVLDLSIAMVNVVIVYHPGWAIYHPGVASRAVEQVWPAVPHTPLAPLPVRERAAVKWWTPGPYIQLPSELLRADTLPPLEPNVPPEELVAGIATGGGAPRVG
ncbi:hypothetical protein Acsp06_19650 [Actinomycetospora sp. NBRC 106375]|nr:hypothetical protein Acsp06_19650 [Actinomycetospora sp. NBRC 106375]